MSIRVLLLAFICVTALSARATSRFVANNGADGVACGPSVTPCRSISQAITNAVDGDRIIVRPGVYSDDLNANGIYGESGEEPNHINVTKSVAIESTGGAAATVIRQMSSPGDMVDIYASAVQFGKVGKGFTLRLAGAVNTTGVAVLNGATTVVIAGNVLSGPVNVGFGVVNSDPFIHDNRIVCAGGSGQIGFLLLLPSPGTRLDRNSVEGCSTGYGGGGSGVVITRNLAIDNSGSGFDLSSFATFSKNAAIGNRGAGLVLDSGGMPGVLTSNTFSGNRGIGNCGIQNNTGASVTATNNYWGAASGPGPDPADQACDAAGSTTITTPFATSDFTPGQAALR